MKKKFEKIKTLQLILLIAAAVFGIVIVFTDTELYHSIAENEHIRVMFALLWAVLAGSFIFILWDFSSHHTMKRSMRDLDYAVYNDRVTGIANRYSCDAMIEKYAGKKIPDDLCCIMLDISNIAAINERFGHAKGNDAIRDFSDILHNASLGLCFIGRNGGNKFMALFEECTKEKIDTFMSRVNRKTEEYNGENEGLKLEYRIGTAYSRDESVETVNRLISLADRRLEGRTDNVSGMNNRAGVDDIIAAYLDKPLPEQVGCVMLEITNIRDINDRRGNLAGNRAIRSFADILRESAAGLCYAGRNGGTKFLAVFEECSEEKLKRFLKVVAEKTQDYNAASEDTAIEYRCGQAFREGAQVTTINRLIALADRRLEGRTDNVSGMNSRASVDDIIAEYLDKPLPKQVGCVMLELSNIRAINEAYGNLAGNRAIRSFGDILRESAVGLCYVGRNGGTKFLALFEECSDDKLERFLKTVAKGTRTYNAESGEPVIEYRYARAFDEGPKITTINRLLALADSRCREEG